MQVEKLVIKIPSVWKLIAFETTPRTTRKNKATPSKMEWARLDLPRQGPYSPAIYYLRDTIPAGLSSGMTDTAKITIVIFVLAFLVVNFYMAPRAAQDVREVPQSVQICRRIPGQKTEQDRSVEGQGDQAGIKPRNDEGQASHGCASDVNENENGTATSAMQEEVRALWKVAFGIEVLIGE
jgi:hypothetical protein